MGESGIFYSYFWSLGNLVWGLERTTLSSTTKRSGIGDPKSTGLGATNLLTVSLDQADSTISSESKVRPDPKTTSASHSRQTSASDAFAHGHTDREPTLESQQRMQVYMARREHLKGRHD